MYKSTKSALCNQQQMRAECAFPLEFALQLCYPNNLLKETNLRRDKLVFQALKIKIQTRRE